MKVDLAMATVQKPTSGIGNSITSIATGSNSHSVSCETNLDGSGVALKVRKPYTISKQREKWTEEEHQKFIEALKLFGRAWRQIEDYIGTKTAVQIRSHAQKFFSKVTKEGANSVEASNEAIKIPPPRPKRKPSHPYPRKLAEAPNKSCPNIQENGTSSNLKTMERKAQSPTSVLSPEGSHTSTPHLKGQGSGSVTPTSSGSNLSHVLDMDRLTKNNSTLEEKERDISLTLTLSVPSLNASTIMHAGKEFKGAELTNDDGVYLEAETMFVGGGDTPLTTIKLFGHTVVVAKPLELSAGMENVVSHTATRDLLMFSDLHLNPLVSKGSHAYVSSPGLGLGLDGQLVPTIKWCRFSTIFNLSIKLLISSPEYMIRWEPSSMIHVYILMTFSQTNRACTFFTDRTCLVALDVIPR
uniref:Uncharacterized protein n=1 Tax=Kalanchoe fedtschenkoi TaxID=63787 RepID=A0A7N0VDP9_KALFE